jgi:hypothetical protein
MHRIVRSVARATAFQRKGSPVVRGLTLRRNLGLEDQVPPEEVV